jgi:methyl-accepting chemotaxis protein
MAYSAKNVKESLGQGEDMERDEKRVEPHISGVRNLSETAREMRAAGRKLVNEDDDKEKDIDDYDRLSGAVKKLQESVDAQRAEVAQAVKRMNQILYEMRGLVDEVERIYTDARDESHSAEQAALNGVNKAQEKAQEITLRNIDEATQRSKKAIDTMVLESKRRIERLAMVTLPDRMFHFLKWTALMLVLFILVHIVWQMFS